MRPSPYQPASHASAIIGSMQTGPAILEQTTKRTLPVAGRKPACPVAVACGPPSAHASLPTHPSATVEPSGAHDMHGGEGRARKGKAARGGRAGLPVGDVDVHSSSC